MYYGLTELCYDAKKRHLQSQISLHWNQEDNIKLNSTAPLQRTKWHWHILHTKFEQSLPLDTTCSF